MKFRSLEFIFKWNWFTIPWNGYDIHHALIIKNVHTYGMKWEIFYTVVDFLCNKAKTLISSRCLQFMVLYILCTKNSAVAITVHHNCKYYEDDSPFNLFWHFWFLWLKLELVVLYVFSSFQSGFGPCRQILWTFLTHNRSRSSIFGSRSTNFCGYNLRFLLWVVILHNFFVCKYFQHVEFRHCLSPFPITLILFTQILFLLNFI